MSTSTIEDVVEGKKIDGEQITTDMSLRERLRRACYGILDSYHRFVDGTTISRDYSEPPSWRPPYS